MLLQAAKVPATSGDLFLLRLRGNFTCTGVPRWVFGAMISPGDRCRKPACPIDKLIRSTGSEWLCHRREGIRSAIIPVLKFAPIPDWLSHGF